MSIMITEFVASGNHKYHGIRALDTLCSHAEFLIKKFVSIFKRILLSLEGWISHVWESKF